VRIGRCDSIQGLPVSGRVIGHAVWLYHRFALSLRDVEELARGVVVTYETIRSWCPKFGPDFTAPQILK
jgi:putative transposase